MKANQCTLILILSFMIAGMGNTQAQDDATYQLEPSSQMTISGTSSLHDWESIVEEIHGTATLVLVDSKVEDIKDLVVTIPARGIKSGHTIMDDKTYRALMDGEYPNIVFRGTGIEETSDNSLLVSGILSVAGVEKEVEIPVVYELNEQKLIVSGSLDLKMTDFNIEPPTALFGTLKTGDEITISFNSELREEIL